jgi:PH (Pleckstrin Homology) domain-containing protein
MPSERIVTAVRMHPIAIIRPGILILAGLIVVGIVNGNAGSGSGGFVKIIWILWFVLLVWQGWKIVTWWRRYFVVTENRLMLITSLIDTDVGMMPLAKVTDLRLHQSSFGRAFGYGNFIVESAGQDQALSRVELVPYPSQMYQEILALIFPERPTAEGPPEPPGPQGPPEPPGPQGPPEPPRSPQEPPEPTEPLRPSRPSWPWVPGQEPPERPGDDPGF